MPSRGRRCGLLVFAFQTALAGWSCETRPVATATPVSPTASAPPPVVSFAGTWDLTVLMTACESPWSRYVCGRPPIVPTHQTLRLAQLGSSVTGLLNGMDVAGEVAGGGDLTLRGQGIIADYGGTSTLTAFDARRTASGLEGTIGTESWIPLNFEPLGGTHRVTWTILSASRSALPATFSGVWVGHFQERGCTGARCAGPAQELTLTLLDDSGLVTGSLDLRLNQHARIAGRAVNDMAELSSVGDDGTPGSFVVTEMRVARNATGRLTGTLRVEYPRSPPQDLELVGVALQGVR